MGIGQMSALTKRPAIGLSYENLIRSQAANLPNAYALADAQTANAKEYQLQLKSLEDQAAYYNQLSQLSAEEIEAAEKAQMQNTGMGLLSTGLSAYQLWNKLKGSKELVNLGLTKFSNPTGGVLGNEFTIPLDQGLTDFSSTLGSDALSSTATNLTNPATAPTGILDTITSALDTGKSAIGDFLSPVTDQMSNLFSSTVNDLSGMASELSTNIDKGVSGLYNFFNPSVAETVNVGSSALGQGLTDVVTSGAVSASTPVGTTVMDSLGSMIGGQSSMTMAPEVANAGSATLSSMIGGETAPMSTAAAGAGTTTGGLSSFASATAGGLYAAAAILAKDYATSHLSDKDREKAENKFGTPKEDLYLMAEAPIYAGTTMGGPELLHKLIGDNPISEAGDFLKDVEMKATTEIVNFIGDVVEDVFDAIGGLFCFAPGTQITMPDGRTKSIELIGLLEEVAKGGHVNARGSMLADNMYDYHGVKVTGSHAVFERGVWKRVEDSEDAELLFNNRVCVVHTLNTTRHRLLINGILFADYGEVTNSEGMTPAQRLEILNQNENSAIQQGKTLSVTC
jgi:hypothetical protein